MLFTAKRPLICQVNRTLWFHRVSEYGFDSRIPHVLNHCCCCQFYPHVFHMFPLDANSYYTIFVDVLSSCGLRKFLFIRSACCVVLCCRCSLLVSLVVLISLWLISLFSSLSAPRLIYLLLADIPCIMLQLRCNHITWFHFHTVKECHLFIIRNVQLNGILWDDRFVAFIYIFVYL